MKRSALFSKSLIIFTVLASADRNAYKIISRFRVPLGNGPHFSHPVIHKGRMYIRHGSALMAYRIST